MVLNIFNWYAMHICVLLKKHILSCDFSAIKVITTMIHS